jgi:hypothetical protein
MEEGREPQSFLDRPVRSLLDLKIGAVLKGYLVYVALGLVVGIIGLAVMLSMRGSGDEGTALGSQGSIRWEEGAGDTVTPAQYRAVSPQAQLETVRRRLGEPATTGPNPFDQVTGREQTCLGYRSSASDSLFLFCFEGGTLVEKQTF